MAGPDHVRGQAQGQQREQCTEPDSETLENYKHDVEAALMRKVGLDLRAGFRVSLGVLPEKLDAVAVVVSLRHESSTTRSFVRPHACVARPCEASLCGSPLQSAQRRESSTRSRADGGRPPRPYSLG